MSVMIICCPVCGESGGFEDGGAVFQTEYRGEERDGVWQNVPYLIQHSSLVCKCGARSIDSNGTTIDPVVQRQLNVKRGAGEREDKT